ICSKAGDPLTVTNITLSEYPVVPGTNLTISFAGNLTVPVVNGTKIRVTAKVGFFTAYDQTIDVCSQENVTCPYAPGPQTLSFLFPVPSNVPNVTADVKAVGTLPDGTELACIENTKFQV
ncbi:Phosphatidylglycerol/phosphatidylinositol transfer protein, partial [Blyttiomyces sp. JEL0837]